jgi:hypothetical protein
MSDQGSTPGLRDVVAQDAARLEAEGEPDAWAGAEPDPDQRAAIAKWVRSDDVLRLLQQHYHAGRGYCGCGYMEGDSYAVHLQKVLAKAAEK